MNATLDGIAGVKPLTEKNLITAATASQMCDGASGVMIVSERALTTYSLIPLARLHAFGVTAGDPILMLEEPIPATRAVLKKAGMTLEEIDLFEVNEAFASIPMAWLKEIGADPARLNVKSTCPTIARRMSRSIFAFRSRMTLRLLWLLARNRAPIPSLRRGPMARVTSPSGDSTLMTSAPMSPKLLPGHGTENHRRHIKHPHPCERSRCVHVPLPRVRSRPGQGLEVRRTLS